jgi:hypothetical protein
MNTIFRRAAFAAVIAICAAPAGVASSLANERPTKPQIVGTQSVPPPASIGLRTPPSALQTAKPRGDKIKLPCSPGQNLDDCWESLNK